MTVEVKLAIGHTFRVTASPVRAFGVLADVPYSVSHFPDVETLEDQGHGVYRWVLKKKSIAGIGHEVVYACRYTSDADAGTVAWTPVNGVGNSAVTGAWAVRADGRGSCIEFATTVRLNLDVPRLLSAVASPFARQTFESQIDTYLDNLQVTLNQ